MTPQPKPAAYKNVQSERDLVSARPRLSGRVLTLRDRDRKPRFVKGAPALAATIVIALLLTTSAIAQERQHAYSEYTYWFDGAFEIGSTELLKMDMRFRAPWVREIISSRAATNGLSTGAHPSRCAGFSTQSPWHWSATGTPVLARAYSYALAAAPSVHK